MSANNTPKVKRLHKTLGLIHNRLIEFLKEDRRFTHSGLNRKSIAASLKTNEKYLCLAVRHYTEEKTLSKLIGQMRLQYSAELLINHPDYTVEAISEECGVKSRRSFYRMFCKYYQCTPIDFRRRFLPDKEEVAVAGNSNNELTLNIIQMKWKLSNTVLLQSIGDKKVLVALNVDEVDYSQVITLNGTAAFIVEQLRDDAYTENELVMRVCDKYDIDGQTARQDIRALIKELADKRLIYSQE